MEQRHHYSCHQHGRRDREPERVFRIHEHVVDRQRYAGDRVQAEAVRELPGTPAPDAAVDREPGEDIAGRCKKTLGRHSDPFLRGQGVCGNGQSVSEAKSDSARSENPVVRIGFGVQPDGLANARFSATERRSDAPDDSGNERAGIPGRRLVYQPAGRTGTLRTDADGLSGTKLPLFFRGGHDDRAVVRFFENDRQENHGRALFVLVV